MTAAFNIKLELGIAATHELLASISGVNIVLLGCQRLDCQMVALKELMSTGRCTKSRGKSL